VSFAAITLCVASQRVFVVVSIYFVTDPVRKCNCLSNKDTDICSYPECRGVRHIGGVEIKLHAF
jgi:hypothetical protein